ncbi:MAG: imidazoleglycerol-phosphate dehydratase HisB [Planctomycetota bacterium]|jgi:imidazoleglycerol phosphate dehydratase HisB
MTADRTATVERRTAETDITLTLNLDGSGEASIETGIGLLDHLLTSLTRHAGLDVQLTCKGDLDVDDHHTAEDCAIALGEGIDQALGERRGIGRFGWGLAPMDEALARAAVDFSGRGLAVVQLALSGQPLGPLEALKAENVTHVLHSLARAARATIHVDVLRGDNDHHRAEAAFKALALAFRQAVGRAGGDRVPSTKETLA